MTESVRSVNVAMNKKGYNNFDEVLTKGSRLLSIEEFEKLMEKVIRFRYQSLAVFSAVLMGAIALMTVGNDFMLFPPDQTEIYITRFETKAGSTLEETLAAGMALSDRIQTA